MTQKLPDLIRRRRAVEATMEKYRHRVFDWKTKASCLHMFRFHLVRMKRKAPALPPVGSLLAAKRALKARGWKDVGDMMDGIGLKEINPAQMLLGDVAMLESEDGLGAIVISVGGKVIGWHDDGEAMVVMEPLEIKRAWRL
jgi:hypothetical protein